MFLIDFSKTFSLRSASPPHRGESPDWRGRQPEGKKLNATGGSWEQEIWRVVHFIADTERKYIEVSTSGSTGQPKKIRLAKENMLKSAAATCKALKLKRGATALLCLPANKIGGMMMIVRSAHLKMKLICVQASSTPLSKLEKGLQIDFAAFTPMQFHEILHNKSAFKKASAIQNILLGGQDAGGKLLKVIRTMPNNVYQTFGMTETISHIALKKISGPDADIAYTTLPGVTVETSRQGCLVIKAPSIHRPRLLTRDVVRLISPTQFEWLGRADNMVNSGGIKIYPEKIEQRINPLIEHPFFVAGVPDELIGTSLVLIIEAKKLSNKEKAGIQKAFSTLDKFHKPREIRLVPQFERTANGKIQRMETIGKTRPNSKKKLSKRERKKLEVLKGIAEGLREIKEAKRTGKKLMSLDEALKKP